VLRAVAVSLVVLVGVARADDAAKRIAAEHHQRGANALARDRFDEAIREFQIAYNAVPDPAFLYNLGQAYRANRDARHAVQTYREYLRLAPDAPNRVKVEGFIRQLEDEYGPVPIGEPVPPPSPGAPHGESAQPNLNLPQGKADESTRAIDLTVKPEKPRRKWPIIVGVVAAVVVAAAVATVVALYMTRPGEPFSLESAR